MSWRLQWPATWQFVQYFVQAIIKENIKAPHFCPGVTGIHRFTMDSPHKVSVMRAMTSSCFTYHARGFVACVVGCDCFSFSHTLKVSVKEPSGTLVNAAVKLTLYIRMASHGSHGVSHHRPLECLFNSLFGLTQNKHQISALQGLCEGIDGSPHKWPVLRRGLPFHDVITKT